jgi:hypothetical protein
MDNMSQFVEAWNMVQTGRVHRQACHSVIFELFEALFDKASITSKSCSQSYSWPKIRSARQDGPEYVKKLPKMSFLSKVP